jgi:integrase
MKAFKVKRGATQYFRVDLPKDLFRDGKRHSVTAKTRNEAIAKAEKEIENARKGLERKSGKITLEQYLLEFLEFYRTEGGLAPSTFEDYKFQVHAKIIPAIGATTLDRLEPRTVDELLRSLRSEGLANRSVSYTHAVLRRALQFAVDWRYIDANPASARMRAAKRYNRRELSKIRYLNREQARAFLDQVGGNRYEALYTIAIMTGMRQGELLALRWSDIALTTSRLTITRSLHRTKRNRKERGKEDRFQFLPPKTDSSRRTIEIPPVAVNKLIEHRAQQKTLFRMSNLGWTEDALVFSTPHGRPLDTSNVLHHFHEILTKAQLPKIRFYDLRHTHASLLISEGVHAKKIAERLGHSSIKLTMDTYGHLFEGSDHESAEKMERLFGSLSRGPQKTSETKVFEISTASYGAEKKPSKGLRADKTADKGPFSTPGQIAK